LLGSGTRPLLAVPLLGVALLLSPGLRVPLAVAADRTDVPLKNWGGFSVYRDAVYDDLERLATAGLADRAILNTRPIPRIEAARMVARAIDRIRRDESGIYNARRDLEAVLDRLMQEFGPELRSLGVKVAVDLGPAPRFVAVLPVDRAQVRAGAATRDLSLVQNQGERFQRGINSAATFESRAQIGDFLTFYLQPEFSGNEEYVAARLHTGYAKLTLWNVELLVGRESLWWGPGFHGALVLGPNAPPLDQVRIGAAEPFRLPWVGEWVGPTKLVGFLARLETRRDHKRAKLAGIRATIAPLTALELGATYANMFDGDDRPRLKLKDYPEALFAATTTDQDVADARLRNNVVFGVDAEFRWSNVDRYGIPARDLRAYVEFGWDDTCCSTATIPDLDASSGLVGVHLLGLLGQEGVDLRLEWARSSILSFTHNQFTRGWWTRGEVLSHVMGTEGADLFARLTARVLSNVMIGLQGGWTEIGNTLSGFTGPKERRLAGGVDISYGFWDRYAIFAQSQLARVENRNFSAGDDGVDYLFRIELTRSFR
jgi:hypothetical protein